MFRRQLGEQLRTRRLELGLSQEDVGLESDVAQGSISNYEAGRSDVPVVVLLRICRTLGLNLFEIVPSVGEPDVGFGETYREVTRVRSTAVGAGSASRSVRW